MDPYRKILSTLKKNFIKTFPKSSGSHSCNHHEAEKRDDTGLEEDVYDGLDASLTVLIHGLESDWIEEEMTDDDDFK